MDEIDREMESMFMTIDIPRINIDPRVDRFWHVDRDWAPYGVIREHAYYPVEDTLDSVYHRYRLFVIAQGITTDDYRIIDTENADFDVKLKEFLDMHDSGKLPVETNRKDYRRHRIIRFTVSVLVIVALIIVVAIFVLALAGNPNIPTGVRFGGK